MSSALRRWTHASTSAVLLLPPLVGWSSSRGVLIAAVLAWGGVEIVRIRSKRAGDFFARTFPVFRPQEVLVRINDNLLVGPVAGLVALLLGGEA